MEYKNLYGFVLIILLVGMLVGVGTLALDKFGVVTKESTNLLESLTFTAGAATTTNDDVTAVSYITNGTVTAPSDNITFTSAGAIVSGNSSIAGAYNISYTYDADTDTTTTTFAGRDAVAEISTTWLTLIVTIGILAIIITMIIVSFGVQR